MLGSKRARRCPGYRPIIGITSSTQFIDMGYLPLAVAVRLAGGRPWRLRAGSTETVVFHGLIVGGGTDIFPGLFRHRARQNYRYDHHRDAMEIALLRHAENERIPVLAICRGAQLLNVVHGGSLHISIEKAFDGVRYPRGRVRRAMLRRRVRIHPESLLGRIMSRPRGFVNSLHSQAINRVGAGLRVTARELNGVIQAVEHQEHDFRIGVQFHPELMLYRKAFRHLFRSFVDAANLRKCGRPGNGE